MKKLLFLAGVALAGCQSERVAFQFQPAATAQAAPSAPEAAIPAANNSEIAPVPLAPAAAGQRPSLARRQAAKTRAAVPAVSAGLVAAKLPLVAKPRLVPRLLLRPRTTSGAAENGLGRIGLFFIAVVLGVLAGLAALVNVIFSVGFFTALGYTAAGLVVLFLLYSLLSGSGKKAKVKTTKTTG